MAKYQLLITQTLKETTSHPCLQSEQEKQVILIARFGFFLIISRAHLEQDQRTIAQEKDQGN
jgi:hypothetical protein